MLVPDLFRARLANARVFEADAVEVEGRWKQRITSSAAPSADAFSQALQAQAERMRGSETKAVGSLQLVALLFAGWIFAAGNASALFRVLLLVALGYMAASVWSALHVLQPSLRHVVGPGDCLGEDSYPALVATAYDLNVSKEVRSANLVTASLRDAVRAAGFVGVAALGPLLG
jgi:hypothetical protein